MEIHLGNIANTIQLAIAPVFLLTGVGTNLGVLVNRLGRIIDRSRVLEERMSREPQTQDQVAFAELTSLYRRASLINRAITLCTACGLSVGLVIASLFIASAADIDLATFIAGCFVLGIFSLIGSFIYLLREIFVATKLLSLQRPIELAK